MYKRQGKAEQIILLEILYDGHVHIAKLAAVALVKDDDHLLVIDRVVLFFLYEGGELLDSRDDDMGVVVLQLLFQYGGG